MRILVTGGAGFLGRYVVAYLSRKAQNYVTVFDNLDPLCGGRGNCLYHDVSHFEEVHSVVCHHKITHIVHLAALGRNLTCQNQPNQAWRVNVTGTQNVLEVARERGCRVIVCSSNIVLSDRPTVYKTTKQTVEALVEMYANLGVSCMGLRPSNIYGKGQSRSEYQPCAFAGLDIAFEKQGYVEIAGSGMQTRDWVHAEDVARAFELALESDITGESLDVCTGVQTSMNDIVRMLQVGAKYVDSRPGDARALISDPQPALDKLGFRSNVLLQDAIWDAFPAIQKAKSCAQSS